MFGHRRLRNLFLYLGLLAPFSASATDATDSLKRSISAKVDSHLLEFAEGGADLKISSHGHTVLTRFPNLPAETVLKLVVLGADPNARDGRGNSVLARAIRAAQDSGTVEALLNTGAEINRVDDSGLTPLQVALLHGRHSCVELLLTRGASLDSIPPLPVLAKRHCSSETLDLLVQHGAKLPLYSPFEMKCALLLADLARIWDYERNTEERYPSMETLAASLAETDCRSEFATGGLIDPFGNPYRSYHWISNETANLITAELAKLGKPRVFPMVSHHPAKDPTWIPLVMTSFLRVSEGDRPLVTLMELGADPDTPLTYQGRTALFELPEFPDLIQLLIGLRANVNYRDQFGCTPLMGALVEPRSATALLNAGAQINAVNHEGGSALIGVAGNEEMVDLCLKNGADPNLRTKSGCTAWIRARRVGSTKILRLLEQHGAVRPDLNRFETKLAFLELEMSLLDAASDQYAIEMSKLGTEPVSYDKLRPYMRVTEFLPEIPKEGMRDPFGNLYVTNYVCTGPLLSAETAHLIRARLGKLPDQLVGCVQIPKGINPPGDPDYGALLDELESGGERRDKAMDTLLASPDEDVLVRVLRRMHTKDATGRREMLVLLKEHRSPVVRFKVEQLLAEVAAKISAAPAGKK